MKKNLLYFLLNMPFVLHAQSVTAKLQAAVSRLQQDEQFRHAAIALYVVDAKTAVPVFAYNAETGLAPASCQKIITSAAAFSILGPAYRFKTEIGYDGVIINGILKGNLVFRGYGDPTLGSPRFGQYKNSVPVFFKRVGATGIREIQGSIYADDSRFEFQNTPSGWVWEDIGNYYGAGAGAFNWNENILLLPLRSGKNVGDPVEILPGENLPGHTLLNNLTTAQTGTGDNAIVFLPPRSDTGSVEGTIPANENRFVVKAAAPDPTQHFLNAFKDYLYGQQFTFDDRNVDAYYHCRLSADTLRYQFHPLATQYSPTLDSINYWFLKKSINLYGEALLKTIAYEKRGFGSTKKGIELVKDFWSANGIDKTAINILDGSGLSPANRITAAALVNVLQFAKKQSWSGAFYDALPDQNGMKMKDGYISGVRTYAGYCSSTSGQQYVFALLVNNFSGNAGTARLKMWKLLDLLK